MVTNFALRESVICTFLNGFLFFQIGTPIYEYVPKANACKSMK